MRIGADVGQLAAVREMVRSVATAAGGDPTFVADLVQAVDETASNAIITCLSAAVPSTVVTLIVGACSI